MQDELTSRNALAAFIAAHPANSTGEASEVNAADSRAIEDAIDILEHAQARVSPFSAGDDYLSGALRYLHVQNGEPEHEGHIRGCICADCSGAELTSKE